MKKSKLVIGTVLVLGMAVVLPAFGQVEGGLDKMEKERRTLEEQKRAREAAAELMQSQQGLLRNVDRLQQRKTTLQRDVTYYKVKLERALKELEMIQKMTPVDKELLDSTQKDVAYYQGRLKVAQDDLEKNDADLDAASKALREAVTGTVKNKIILPGQVLQLFVLEDESFNGLYQVRNGGYVVLPRVGRVSVVGKDLTDAEKSVKAALESSQLKQATVMLESSAGVYGEEMTDVIYLAGEFKNTGPLRTPAGVQPTLVTTILRAGGLTASADLTRVKLLRLESGRALVEEVNVQAILDGNGLQSDLALASGDIVVVPSFAPVVYVTGNVKTPGVIRLSSDEDLTAYAAVLRCGGFARFAKLSGVYVLRDRGAGEKVKIPVNIKELQAGKRADVILQGKDIVVVPERFFSF